MSNDRTFVDSLQIGRALAAFAVALQHTIRDADRYYPRYTGTEVGYTADPRGWVELLGSGVDVFFVISGVVMVLSTQGNNRPLVFLYRRFSRIFPLWWLLTAVYIALLLVVPQLFQASYFDPVHATCSMLLIPCTGPEGKVIPLIYAGWTLTYELVFYGLFALSLVFSRRAAQLFACALLVLCWHALHYTPLAANPAILHSSGNIMIEFIFGIALGYWWLERGLPARAGVPLLVVGVALLAVSWQGVLYELPRFIQWGIPALMIVAGLMCLNRARDNQPGWFRLLVFLGAASYSLYLFHFFSLRLFFVGLGKTGLLASVPPLLAIAAGITFTLVASVVVYKLCEKPLHRAFMMPLKRGNSWKSATQSA